MDTKMKNHSRMPTKYKLLILFVIFTFGHTSVVAQLDPQMVPEAEVLDKSIRYGHLPNGFTYFIKSIDSPQPKLYLWLYNKAGHNQEDDDQLDISHAVEHLTFKASKNFPSGIHNSKRMDKLDMGLYDFSAYSGTKLTQYYFNAPSKSSEALKTGLLWFKDIAMGLKLLETDINQVRGELRQEFLARNGDNLNKYFARSELYSKIYPCSNDRSNYFKFLKEFEPKRLKEFYTDWYRPDLLAISVVGNIENINKMEELIKETFSDLVAPEDPRKLKECESAYYNLPPQFTTVERSMDNNKSNKTVAVHMFFRDPTTHQNLHNKIGLKHLIKRQLLEKIINKRFWEVGNEFHSTTLYADDPHKSNKFPSALEIVISSDNNQEEQAIKKAMLVLHQFELYGISAEEWEKLKEKSLQNISSVNLESAKYWIREIKNYYNTGEALPSNKQSYLIEWLRNFSLADFNDYVSRFLSKRPEDIGIIAPPNHKALGYTEREVRSWVESVFSKTVAPYKKPEVATEIMTAEEISALQKKGFIDQGIGESGAREVILNNGVKVVLKPFQPSSGTQHDKVSIHGFSLMGARCFGEDYYSSAINAPSIVRNSGVNGMDRDELNRFLSTTSIQSGAIPYIVDRETGIEGKADLEDLETLLQLIYLHFTRPNKNKKAFENWKIQRNKAYQDPSYSLVRLDFNNAIRAMTRESSMGKNPFGGKSLRGTKSHETIDDTNLNMAYDIYEKLFGNAKDFTFLISGDFYVEAVLPLVEKYLGNLPSHSLTCSAGTLNEKSFPEESLIEIETPGRYQIKNILYGIRFIEKAETPNDWREQLKIQALGGITNQKAWTLRFGKGYSLYMVGVGGSYNQDMGQYEISGTFECVPEEFPMIRQEFNQIISEIKSGLVSEDLFQQGMKRLYYLYGAERANEPRVIHQKLFDYYRYNRPWIDPEKVEGYIKSLTVEDIVETANKFYTEDNFLEFVMRNE